jgi:hypothetical protein
VPVWGADLAIKAVRVPRAHIVTFRFRNAFRQGVVWTTGLGGALLILGASVYVACRVVGQRAASDRGDLC